MPEYRFKERVLGPYRMAVVSGYTFGFFTSERLQEFFAEGYDLVVAETVERTDFRKWTGRAQYRATGRKDHYKTTFYYRDDKIGEVLGKIQDSFGPNRKDGEIGCVTFYEFHSDTHRKVDEAVLGYNVSFCRGSSHSSVIMQSFRYMGNGGAYVCVSEGNPYGEHSSQVTVSHTALADRLRSDSSYEEISPVAEGAAWFIAKQDIGSTEQQLRGMVL
jgi:hypothetical protein